METVIIPCSVGVGLCNLLKNLLSVIRIKKHQNHNFLIDKNIPLVKIFDFPNDYFNENQHDGNIFYRTSWRLAIFDTDKNLDKIIDNEYSTTCNDFNDHLFFKNYKNNCIDYVCRPDLFNDIYEDYSGIFNELIIKDFILTKINNFYCKHFDENTVSIHLRSWVDCPGRQRVFDI